MKAAEIDVGHSGEIETGDVETPVTPGAIDRGDEDVVADGGAAAAADPLKVVDDAVTAEQSRVEGLMDRENGVRQSTIRDKIQETMTENVNVFRNEEGLRQALRDIREAREMYRDVFVEDPSGTFNTDLIQTIETRNLIDLAEAITLGALARDEFRGAHWRQEFQERRDDEWLKHTLLSWNDGDPELFYRPVILEGENKTYEPKIRSY
jgi:succinate dehydrogenase / fumarate reductase flavoprotein subunit